jgi:hypothetical protein
MSLIDIQHVNIWINILACSLIYSSLIIHIFTKMGSFKFLNFQNSTFCTGIYPRTPLADSGISNTAWPRASPCTASSTACSHCWNAQSPKFSHPNHTHCSVNKYNTIQSNNLLVYLQCTECLTIVSFVCHTTKFSDMPIDQWWPNRN